MQNNIPAMVMAGFWLSLVSAASFGGAYEAACAGTMQGKRGELVVGGLLLGLLLLAVDYAGTFFHTSTNGAGWMTLFLTLLGPVSAGIGAELGNAHLRRLPSSGANQEPFELLTAPISDKEG